MATPKKRVVSARAAGIVDPDKPAELTKQFVTVSYGAAFEEPTPDGNYILRTSLDERLKVAQFLTWYADKFNREVRNDLNIAVLDALGDIGVKLLGMNPLSFNPNSDAPTSTDGKLHVTIAPNADNAGDYDVTTTHPAWIVASQIPADDDTGLLSKTPTSANPNSLSSTDPTVQAMSANVAGDGIDIVSGQIPFNGVQSANPVTTPMDYRVRQHENKSQPFYKVSPDGSQTVIVVNGEGEITCRAYTTLPTADVDHLGAIVRFLVGSGQPDLIYVCLTDATGHPAWFNIPMSTQTIVFGTPTATGLAAGSAPTVSLTGTGTSIDPYILHFGIPAGATGAAGSTPVFGTPTATGLSAGSNPTISQTGSGTPGDPYIDHFGIPAGAQGATGPGFSFPALPTNGATATFWTPVLPGGTFLPFPLPVGYTAKILSTWGNWAAQQPSQPTYITTGNGTLEDTGDTVVPTRLTTNLPTALAIIAELFDNNGEPIGSGSTLWQDPFSTITMTQLSNIMLVMNTNWTAIGLMWAQIQVVAPASSNFDWTAFINFGATAGGFAPFFTGSGTRDSSGWHGGAYTNPDSCYGIDIALTFSSNFTLRGIEFVGNYTPSGSTPNSSCRYLGEETLTPVTPNSHFEVMNPGSLDRIAPYSNTNEVSACSRVRLFAFVDFGCAGGTPAGNETVTGVTIKGHGTIPSELAPYII